MSTLAAVEYLNQTFHLESDGGFYILHPASSQPSTALKRSFPKVSPVKSQDLCQDPTPGCQLSVKSTKWGTTYISTLKNVNRNIRPQSSIDLHSPSTVLGLHLADD